MQPLTTAKRAAIIQCLCEGNSIASTTRITGAAKHTILDLLAPDVISDASRPSRLFSGRGTSDFKLRQCPVSGLSLNKTV